MRAPLIDTFGRKVTYLRLSLTDRCDLRCFYCMNEAPQFMPKRELLSLEELDRVSSAFIGRGVRKLRLTGGEPLVRRGIMTLVSSLARHLDAGVLDELTLTTNGSLLAHYAADLAKAGVRRINVSLDTLKPDLFRSITRIGKLGDTLTGIEAALAAGIKVKLNTVALQGLNDEELPDLVRFAHDNGMEITFIEVMPVGEAMSGRAQHFLSMKDVKAQLCREFTLTQDAHRSGGPAHFLRTDTGDRIGFIAATSCNFCAACNRVRLTATGRLETCLGREEGVDLRPALRSSEADETLHGLIDAAIARKPKGHDFETALPHMGAIARPMSRTGG
jgi:cyclic pyranopterin phosphate synthase